MKNVFFGVFSALSCVLPNVYAQSNKEISEQDFFEEVPVVLSVSRLSQRLDEAPGAVTVLDRAMIQQTGARDIADLLRFVPGFRVSDSFESNTPQASYHNNLGDYSNRVQVLVDGRSVYSTFLWGSTGPGLQSVAIDNIERIEVIRGSNAAAYGARAFLGMINIVTRDTANTVGTSVHVAGGDNGIQDTLVRLGWGTSQSGYRLTVDQRADGGLSGAAGADRVNRVNFRWDVQATPGDRMEVRLGQSVIASAVGFAGADDIGLRTRWISTSFAQLDWQRVLSADVDIALQASHMEEWVQDRVPNTTYTDIVMDFSGRANIDAVSLQQNMRVNPDLRVVMGGELRRESLVSRAMYDTDAALNTDFYRFFGNAEWHLAPSVVFNAGGMWERHSVSGDTFSPRTMLNWHVSPGQTLRFGVSRAYRPPSTFENSSNQVYRSAQLAAAGFPNGEFVNFRSRGGLRPESINAQEIGYLGNFDPLHVALDVRLFNEDITDVIKERKEANDYTKYYVNTLGASYEVGRVQTILNIHGLEYQLKWRPWEGGQFAWSQLFIDNGQLDPRSRFSSASLMFSQKFAADLSLSVMGSHSDAIPEMPGEGVPGPAVDRWDLRVAKGLRLGAHKGELSFTIQNLGPDYPDFLPTFYFRRQAFVALKLDL
jgi:iron complex outermembrane receptor protein